jgi:hypothetical protein
LCTIYGTGVIYDLFKLCNATEKSVQLKTDRDPQFFVCSKMVACLSIINSCCALILFIQLIKQNDTHRNKVRRTEMELVCGSEEQAMEIEDTKRATEVAFQVVIRPNVFVNVQPCACS